MEVETPIKNPSGKGQPLYKGHFLIMATVQLNISTQDMLGPVILSFVREIDCSSEVQNVLTIWEMNIWDLEVCPLYRG